MLSFSFRVDQSLDAESNISLYMFSLEIALCQIYPTEINKQDIENSFN